MAQSLVPFLLGSFDSEVTSFWLVRAARFRRPQPG